MIRGNENAVLRTEGIGGIIDDGIIQINFFFYHGWDIDLMSFRFLIIVVVGVSALVTAPYGISHVSRTGGLHHGCRVSVTLGVIKLRVTNRADLMCCASCRRARCVTEEWNP